MVIKLFKGSKNGQLSVTVTFLSCTSSTVQQKVDPEIFHIFVQTFLGDGVQPP